MDIRRKNFKGENMINLILKELIITRKYLILGSALICILGSGLLLSKNDMTGYFLFILINLVIVFISCDTEMKSDIMKKSDIIMTSLPLRRENIIKSKYIIFGFYPFISNILLYLITTFLNKYSFIGEISKALGGLENGIGPDVIFYSLAICLIYISVSMPLYYFLGENSKLITYILIMSLFIIPDWAFRFFEKHTNLSITKHIFGIDTIVLSFLSLGIALALYLASMYLSINIYNKKEF